MRLNRFAIVAALGGVAAALLVLPAVATAQTKVRYHVVKLAEIPAPSGCVPTAINDNGDVVGYCDAGGTTSFAVVWRGGAVEDLGRWGSGTFTHAWAINSAGVVVGDGDDGNLDPKALLRGATAWIPLDLSGGSAQAAYGITDDGVIIGNYTTQRHPGTETWNPVYWTYDPAHDRYDRHDLPKPPGTTISGAFIFAATKLGIAVGEVASDLVGNQAGLWLNDATHSLVVLDRPTGFASGAAQGVSDDGRAAGYASNVAGTHAILWQNDAAHTAIDVGAFPGDTDAQASGVNTAGQVVGTSLSPVSALGRTARGFLFEDGTLKDLAALIDAADGAWTIDQAIGINNAGQIIAVGAQNGQRLPLLLNPVTVSCAPISIVAPGASATVGQAISITLSASGGTGPYAYTVSSGALPDGLSLSSAGVISGTPTTAGEFTFTVSASDAGQCGGSATMTVSVAKATPVITWPVPADITFGTQLSSVQLNATASVPGTFLYTPPAGFMPPPGTMLLTVLFTPTDGANYTTAVANVSLTVVDVVPPDANPIQQPIDQVNSVGDRVQLQVFVLANLLKARFSATGLPPSLKISSDTGLISGMIKKRSEGVYSTTVTFTVKGQTFSRTFTWTVR